MTTFDFEAIGTRWRIDIYQQVSDRELQKLKETIFARIETYDKTYSRFRADSLITQIARKAGEYIFPDDAERLFSLYHDLYSMTDGYFTPLVGDLLVDAGYDAQYTLRQKRELRSAYTWDEAIVYAHPLLTVKKPTWIDVGAAGKGYLVDIIAELLHSHGISSYCVNGSGDIRYHNDQTVLNIGLEDPDNTNKVIGVYPLVDGSICGSAHNRRTWNNFSHIIDPKKHISPKQIKAVWVIASTTLLADALTTCLFFVEPSTLMLRYQFEYLIVYADRSIQKSPGFKGTIFVQ